MEGLSSALAAILAAWLGATVITRSAADPAARVFALVTLLLTAWSGAIALRHLSADPSARFVLEFVVQEATRGLLPAALMHLVATFTTSGRPSTWQRRGVITAYAVAGLVAARAIFDPGRPFHVDPPHFTLPMLPGEVMGWTWVALRLLMLGIAVLWAIGNVRHAGSDRLKRFQAIAVLGAVGLAAIGGTLRVLPPGLGVPGWLGIGLILGGLVFATYAVFAQRVFLAPEVARRAFAETLITGLLIALFLGVLLAANDVVSSALALEAPVVLAIAVVITLAVFDPVRGRVRGLIYRFISTTEAEERLLRLLGQTELVPQSPAHAVGPALSRLMWRFGLSGVAVISASGGRLAVYGEPDETPLALTVPLGALTVLFGAKRSALPFTRDERDLLQRAASYVDDALRLAERQSDQANALARLSRESLIHQALAESLDRAIISADEGLQVFALGPLRVERGGQLVRNWGGAKAGSRQAEAVFAFLYDRRERGAAKDEFLEIIWPDLPLDRADLAFHRTLGGLRRTLDPQWSRGAAGPISFHNDRYRLSPTVVGWSDDAAFLGLIVESAVSEPETQLRMLERARALYRGEYLDDCPFYGESAEVEERRGVLRGRYIDLLLRLGERYEARGDRSAAAAAFRDALAVTAHNCPPAMEGLLRIGVPA